jgi:hypothetical protein
MQERSFRQDLAGSDESLEHLLARLKAQLVRPKARPGRYPPPDSGHFVTSRRPLGGAGGAEAPLPVERALPDCCPG